MSRLRYVWLTVSLFAILGALLEGFAFVIAFGFAGFAAGRAVEFVATWTYLFGFWPSWALPELSPRWTRFYPLAPVIWWGVVGIPVGFWIASRKNREQQG